MTKKLSYETPVEVTAIKIPNWIEKGITLGECIEIVRVGCGSGAYMGAVTYSTAMSVMNAEGDKVFDYLENYLGEVPAPKQGDSWASMACHYLSCAVECWAFATLSVISNDWGKELDVDLEGSIRNVL